MKIYLVSGWIEYEGSSIITVTTSKEQAEQFAYECSLPYQIDHEDGEKSDDRWYYDGIEISIWKNGQKISTEVYWKHSSYDKDT